MNILLLGGTGAIGVPLVKILSENNNNNIYVTSRKARKTETSQVTYLYGNAHNIDFVRDILKKYQLDIIVDFMVYPLNEFAERLNLYLDFCKQYIFLSSSRVYAPTHKPINESSGRLLDVCNEEKYLVTEEYALAKAHEENLLFSSKKKNWTIIRPYITYGSHRLQLGIYEKEQWLYRALNGRTIVFSEEAANTYTTLTSGYDVSKMISNVIGNKYCIGQTYQITCNMPIKWGTVLNIYADTLESIMGSRPKIKMVKTSEELGASILNPFQLKFDRGHDRKFYSNKIECDIGVNFDWTSPVEGLKRCLSEFLRTEDKVFQPISWKSEAYLDKITGERTPLSTFEKEKDKIKYLTGRYTPYFSFKDNSSLSRYI